MSRRDPIKLLIAEFFPVGVAEIINGYARRTVIDGLFLWMNSYGLKEYNNSISSKSGISSRFAVREFGGQRVIAIYISDGGYDFPGTIIYTESELDAEFFRIIAKKGADVSLRENSIRECVQIGCNHVYAEWCGY
jgi:hypothetical protein